MPATADRRPRTSIHPIQAFLLASIWPLFLGGLLSDLAYFSNYHIQWSNFAAWLIVGGMVFTGLALAWALVDLLRAPSRRGRPLLSFLLLLTAFILGLLNSFVHARDAWATMPDGLILSVIVTIIASLAILIGFGSLRAGEVR